MEITAIQQLYAFLDMYLRIVALVSLLLSPAVVLGAFILAGALIVAHSRGSNNEAK